MPGENQAESREKLNTQTASEQLQTVNISRQYNIKR